MKPKRETRKFRAKEKMIFITFLVSIYKKKYCRSNIENYFENYIESFQPHDSPQLLSLMAIISLVPR